jgi:cell division septum initiation protein DivIVA
MNDSYEKKAVDNLLEKIAEFIGDTLQEVEKIDTENRTLQQKVAELSNEKVELEKVAGAGTNVKPQLVDALLDRMVDIKLLPGDERVDMREKLANDSNGIFRLAINLTKQLDSSYQVGQGTTKQSSSQESNDLDPDGWGEVVERGA